jgi:hypothetical protein
MRVNLMLIHQKWKEMVYLKDVMIADQPLTENVLVNQFERPIKREVNDVFRHFKPRTVCLIDCDNQAYFRLKVSNLALKVFTDMLTMVDHEYCYRILILLFDHVKMCQMKAKDFLKACTKMIKFTTSEFLLSWMFPKMEWVLQSIILPVKTKAYFEEQQTIFKMF